ncbi:aminotransferase class IV [Flagellimonas alvinocaridis]|uniref:branched-chain-amino-acid transaminase n=1 Tax=Flagellimonas alvinocaridis TaxID=2530200 RepID=A0A4V4HWI5_9FLAO|nr:aminotransferase class IV [Allomuricauda alvinocaridis]THV57246.1 aminotransferase class IV [Allomuricauda alvinocaridis]
MVNLNGKLFSSEAEILTHKNRGLKYGDALFETLRCIKGDLFFWEDHYFRLMASMRIVRMEIPMEFTMEFLEGEIKNTIVENQLENEAVRVRVTVFRNDGGLYSPLTNTVSYLIEVEKMESPFYLISENAYEVELFKDYYVNRDMLSNLKSTNKILNVVASVYAQENGCDSCLLINTDKHVVEAIGGNLFVVHGDTIKTPPLADGCLDGIIRKKIIEIVEATEAYQFAEESISPFELQKADELFITNSIVGIQPISKYRKKVFKNEIGKNLVGKLNAKARMAQTS